ncbi:hypothetical protein RMR10_010105 [Agrobacterium rosae]|uniref:hypothetical protein n=1 Tax=Agrobacterium rosae TaxID=1972867 RepID=UPI002A1469F9|nr:hypothetical protein [Agrobacterium rosae]MDX8312974.1 hypothetical protein [Agrobacterium rosae]
MKTFTVDVTSRITVILDETKFTAIMPEFNECISDFGTNDAAFERHAKHIARLAAGGEDFSDCDFVEGYGIVHEAGIDVTVHNATDIEIVSEGGAV